MRISSRYFATVRRVTWMPASSNFLAICSSVSGLRRMRVFAGYGAAHRGWMHTDFLGHFLDHHRLERVGSLVQKFPLPRDDGLADAQDGVLALLDVFHQLHGGGETLFDIVAHITVGSILDQQAAVGG